VIILSGSKGPLFSLLLTWVVVKLSSSKHYIKSVVLIFFVLSVSSVSLPYLLGYLSSDLQFFIDKRFNLITDDYNSMTSRISMIEFGVMNFGLRGITYMLFGNGIGDFFYAFKYAEYPHNLIIEILFEFGLIGILGLYFALRFLFLKLRTYNSLNITGQYITFSSLYFLFISMSTGDIAGNYLFFSFLMLLYLYHKNFNYQDSMVKNVHIGNNNKDKE
jgi:hypothetical protein